MKMETCILCGDQQLAEDMSPINEKGTKACPRCIFLLALYHTLGIKKKLFSGSLMPHKLNSRFQKILQEEFYKKPKATYRKYLGSLIDEEEDKIGLIRMEEKDFNSVKDESFPFVFLDEAVANRLQIAPGRELNLQIGDDGSNRLQRKVFSSKLLSVKDARKYGYKKKKVVCFVTENL